MQITCGFRKWHRRACAELSNATAKEWKLSANVIIATLTLKTRLNWSDIHLIIYLSTMGPRLKLRKQLCCCISTGNLLSFHPQTSACWMKTVRWTLWARDLTIRGLEKCDSGNSGVVSLVRLFTRFFGLFFCICKVHFHSSLFWDLINCGLGEWHVAR